MLAMTQAVTDSNQREAATLNKSAPMFLCLIVVLTIALILHPRIGLLQNQNERHIYEALQRMALNTQFDQKTWWEVRERASFGQFHLPKHLVEFLEIQTLKLGPICGGQLVLTYSSSHIATEDFIFFENDKSIGDSMSDLGWDRSVNTTIFDDGKMLVEISKDKQSFIFWSKDSIESFQKINGIYGSSSTSSVDFKNAYWVSKNTIRFQNKKYASMLEQAVLSKRL